MRSLLRLLRILAVALVIAGLLLSAGAWIMVQRTLPQTSGTLAVPGLRSSVEVIRDAWGVPHIYAQSADDALFAQGYIVAQDRLWQMEFNRRMAAGRISEFGGQATLKDDILLRSLGLRRSAEADVQRLDDASRRALEAYARGVNAFADSHRDRLPLEFTLLNTVGGADIEWQSWTPTDTVAVGKVMALALSMNMSIELFRSQLWAQLGRERASELEPGYPAEGPFIVSERSPLTLPSPRGGEGEAVVASAPPAPQCWGEDVSTPSPCKGEGWDEGEAADISAALERVLYMARSGRLPNDDADTTLTFNAVGSNNWVVGGGKTSTGKPFLANDPHLSIQNPSVWYEIHLDAPDLRIAGVTFVGVPGVVLGHNERIAWGATNSEVDVQDLFIEKINPNNPRQYEFRGQWVDGDIWHEEIVVNGQATPVVKDILVTRHGPIITEGVSDRISEPVALRWTAHDPGTLFQAVGMLWTARNWQDFQAAMRLWDVPSQNIVYADVDGNIGYQMPGRIPVRAGGEGSAPVPGWTGEHEWTGWIPYDDLPSAYNPAAGFVASANNRVVSYDYPYYLSDEWAPPYRITRINDLIAATDRHTLHTMRDIQADVYAIPDRELVPYILALAPQTSREQAAHDVIAAWDYRTTLDSVAATIVETTLGYVMRYTFADELGKRTSDYLDNGVPVLLRILPDNGNRWFDDVTTGAVETRDGIVQRSLRQALADLEKTLGNDMRCWTWGRVHTATFDHDVFGEIPLLNRIFNVGPAAVPGSGGNGFTVYAANYHIGRSPSSVFNISSMRAIYDLADFDRSLMVNSVGQSGQPGSKHYGDMVTAWRDVQHHAMPFSRAAVEQHTKDVLLLTPS